MDKEALLEFENEYVKLVFKGGFRIDGKITHIYDDYFRFETQDGVSLISFDNIMLIVRREQQ